MMNNNSIINNGNYSDKRRAVARERRLDLLAKLGSGQAGATNLSFIREAMGRSGVHNAELGRLAGMKKQVVHYFLEVADNCRLSEAEKMCAALGFTVRFDVSTSSVIGKWAPVKPEESHMPAVIKEAARGGKRLSALASLVISKEYSVVTLSQRTGMARTKIYRIFQQDDTDVVTIRELVEKLGNHIDWKLKGPDGDIVTVSQSPFRGKPAELANRLSPLVERMESLSLRAADLTEKTGVPERQVLSDLRGGDTTLGRLSAYAGALGMTAVVSFSDNSDYAAPVPERKAHPSENLELALGTPMGPIARVILDSGLGISRMARLSGVSERKLGYCLKDGDIQLSAATKIAAALGKALTIKFECL